MLNTELHELKLRVSALALFRGINDEAPIKDLVALLQAAEYNAEEGVLADHYGKLCRSIYAEGGDLSRFVLDHILNRDDFFVRRFTGKSAARVSDEIADCLEYELDTLQQLADLKSEDILRCLGVSVPLPRWENSPCDIKGEYLELLNTLTTRGYGIFRSAVMFKVRSGKILPVENAEYQTLSQLYGYEAERTLVLKNTEALADGKRASNVLLYGDAGTGKSSTVKACAAALFDKGVRLIEFDKSQVAEIPEIAEQLSSDPLKFIFFIDDLTFEDNDSDFYALKGILEGNVSGTGSNILIYATSNRRHLIKETSAQRQGDDLHLNDTLQELMSLSARFGLTITFMKPEKDLYLEIMEKLAVEQGLIPEDPDPEVLEDLRKRAEAYAIRSNGRSPRTAKQFVTLAGTGLR